jgi:hypothetical protein
VGYVEVKTVKDSELRDVLTSILNHLATLVAQVNEATITAHSIRMAIADVDPKMTVQIREQYLRLEQTSTPLIEEATAAIHGMIRTLNADSKKDGN